MSTLATNKKQFVICASPEQFEEHESFISKLSEYALTVDFKTGLSIENSIFVLLGGDGSLNYLINNFTDDDFKLHPKVIYMPTGTANDFARSLKVDPTEPHLNQVESILRQNQFIDVPLMLCNEKKFINVASAGAPARVTNSGADLLKKTIGKISYYLNTFEELINPDIYKLEVHSSSGYRSGITTAGFFISQGLFAGGGVKISTSYSANFGAEFNFVSVNSRSMLDSITSVFEVQKEQPNLDKNYLISEFIEDLTIQANKSIPVKLDGEEYESDSFHFCKSKHFLRFFRH